jgi:hypothetical protein
MTRGSRGTDSGAFRRLLAGALLVATPALSGCAHQGGAGETPRAASRAPQPDSITVALWHLDETAGARLGDSGPFRLEGTSGVDARPEFGRFDGGRRFQRSIQSFVFVERNPVLQPRTGFTCEAWIYPDAYGQYEDTPIAGCWFEEPDHKSWLFTLGGRWLRPPQARIPSPGFHADLIPSANPGRLIFAILPEEAGSARAFMSLRTVPVERWTHVAVTFDGNVVRFYIDGLMDSQYGFRGRIRPSQAPLMIGNAFDPRRLNQFGGYLRAEMLDANPYYAFEGTLDEVRISSLARTDFSHGRR